MAGELADALTARIDKLITDRLDVLISSRLAAASYIAPDNAGIGAVKEKTDLIPAGGPPSAGDYTPARASKLDQLDVLLSSRAASADYTPARASKLDQLDVPLSSRAASADYTPARAALLDKLDALISSRATDLGVWAAVTRTLTSLPSVIKSIQYVDAAMVSVGGVSVTIAPVAVAKAILIPLGTYTSGADFMQASVRMWLSSSTVVDLARWSGTNSAYPNFCVVEFV